LPTHDASTRRHVISRLLVAAALTLLLLPIGVSWAQLAAPNAVGVSMGHLHYYVRDVAANRRFWMSLGAQPIRVGPFEGLKFPDVMVFLTEGQPSGGSAGSVVNHVAFRVQTFAQLERVGFKVERTAEYPGVGATMTPEGERIELFENSATNLTFTPAPGAPASSLLERHNRPLPIPIAFHHVHLYVPEGAATEAQAWYAKVFGAIPGKRWRYDAADLPGVNLNFSGNPMKTAPTKGRMLDHIGFEVKNLETFCKSLARMGITFDRPYTKGETLSSAIIVDPWGTSIELTEGLGAL
jgi:catechol 2,3-dioxygenase-like lactoylglutathione lyase family enzyme